jgi:hypothetical protein
MIPDSATNIHAVALFAATELARKAKAANLSVVEWGRYNWRERQMKLNIRLALVSTIKKLDRLTNAELDALVLWSEGTASTSPPSEEVGASRA